MTSTTLNKKNTSNTIVSESNKDGVFSADTNNYVFQKTVTVKPSTSPKINNVLKLAIEMMATFKANPLTVEFNYPMFLNHSIVIEERKRVTITLAEAKKLSIITFNRMENDWDEYLQEEGGKFYVLD